MPKPGFKGTAAERFWRKVDKTGDCWVWTGGKHKDGYGLTGVTGKTELAHRVAWEFTNGKIPEGLHVLHKCDNPPCVRPDHLFVGTHLDNMQDMNNKGRLKTTGMAGEKHPLSVLSEVNVLDIREMAKTMTQTSIALIYKVSRQAVGDIVCRRNWRHI